MTLPSDSELQKIVERVVQRMQSQPKAAPAAPSQLVVETPAEAPNPGGTKVVAIGADHGGYSLKEILETHLKEKGYEVVDFGTHNQESVDYPDFAKVV
ncbi:MAG: RpiB/LacA/LacB family sugar-phosphate isomerase, partial [Chloroflexota bacterium]